MAFRKLHIPIIQVGKFAGTPVDKLPLSYLRWMMTQHKFPKDVMEAARRKLDKSSFNNNTLYVTRHALDMFSLRFINRWYTYNATRDEPLGLSSFVSHEAQEAWDNGNDVSKRRHSEDGVIRDYKGLQWVFAINYAYPEYKDVITVTRSDKKLDNSV